MSTRCAGWEGYSAAGLSVRVIFNAFVCIPIRDGQYRHNLRRAEVTPFPERSAWVINLQQRLRRAGTRVSAFPVTPPLCLTVLDRCQPARTHQDIPDLMHRSIVMGTTSAAGCWKWVLVTTSRMISGNETNRSPFSHRSPRPSLYSVWQVYSSAGGVPAFQSPAIRRMLRLGMWLTKLWSS